MNCKIIVTQEEIDKNPMFFLYNALYSDEIRLKDMGKFIETDLISYFTNRNLKINIDKVLTFIDNSLDNGLICEYFKGYCILPR